MYLTLKSMPELCLQRYPTDKNRLSGRIDSWESIGASNWILKILREGYAMPFVKQLLKCDSKTIR